MLHVGYTGIDSAVGRYFCRGAHLNQTPSLKQLGDLIPTPRAAKRLVNVYRLIRVQLTPAERARFVRKGDGTFHAVMLFLALNARFPSNALELFDRIAAAARIAPGGAASWSELRDKLEREPGHDAGVDRDVGGDSGVQHGRELVQLAAREYVLAPAPHRGDPCGALFVAGGARTQCHHRCLTRVSPFRR
jgi:hypothetical protein